MLVHTDTGRGDTDALLTWASVGASLQALHIRVSNVGPSCFMEPVTDTVKRSLFVACSRTLTATLRLTTAQDC